MEIDILLNDEIIVNDKVGYYIIKKEGKGYGLYRKSGDNMIYYTAFKDMIDALKYVKARLK